MKKKLISILSRLVSALIIGMMFLPALPTVTTVRAQTNVLQLSVVNADDNSAITSYRYLINLDNTGDPFQARDAGCSPTDPGYPDSCDWPSIRSVPSSAPIYTSGNQDDFGAGLNLPDGKYLISVMADGYKLGGVHITVPLADPGTVTVSLSPHPLPPATMRIRVFEDISPTNGAFDAPAEHGLQGFKAVINDTLGQISTDVFGNPLCTVYDAAGEPLPGDQQPGDACLYSNIDGDIVIPNLGPLRYDVFIVAPDGQVWLETTTLEGSWSWDTWLQEGGTGLDNEFVVAGEPFPWTVFGFVSPCELGNLNDRCEFNDTLGSASGGVSGTLVAASVYLPQAGGLPYVGDIWTGFNGTKVTGPITDGWVALSDLQQGDTAIYVGPANADGSFLITGVPDGDYMLTWWDYNLHYITDWIQVTVADGLITDLGTPMLTGWFTKVEGYVFIDSNMNGMKDEGEAGKSDYVVVLRDRDNSEIDRMSIAVTTDMNGYYVFEKAYPMGSWMVLEAYNDRYYTTGITYQVDNQPEPTTVMGNGVDVGILPILGQPARLDWGIMPYESGTNGGIVGSVFYDTTRNELDPQYQAVEPWAPGIPNLDMNLWAPVACGTNPGATCDALGMWEMAADGSYAKGQLLNTTMTETWEQPAGCTARDANGDPLPFGSGNQELLPTDGLGGQNTTVRCLEAPLMGTQIQSGFASLDGNWGFADGCFGVGGALSEGVCADGSDPTPLGAGDYLVEVVLPTDAIGKLMYQVVREEDINIFNGDEFVPAVPPPACAGPLHTVDVAGVGADGPFAVDNASFADAGGSPYEGMDKPLCNVKLVNLANGKSVAPTFNLFTDVPIPGRWKGYIINDLTVSTNPLDLNFGEKAGMADAPIGIYDFKNRLVTTITSDPNGVFEVLLPSTYSMNCPSPSGVCPNIYYMLGNDPGQPGALNPNYNPQFRTIGASFEIYPGLFIPSDLAPTQIVVGVLAGGSQYATPPQCFMSPTDPQLFNVSQPYINGVSGGSFSIGGDGFGDTAGQVLLDGVPLTVDVWSNVQLDVTVPAGSDFGTHQLNIITADGKEIVNGLTFHVLGSPYFPQTLELDNFDRANGGLGSNWGGAGNTLGTYRIQHFPSTSTDGVVQVRGTGNTWWLPGSYTADQEAYFTFEKVGASGNAVQSLLLKVNNNPSNSAVLEVAYLNNAQAVEVRTKNNGQNFNATVTRGTIPASFAAGDQFGARVLADGIVKVFKNGTLLGTVDLSAGANPWPDQYLAMGGSIGVRFNGTFSGNNDARFDNFGGGSLLNPDYEPVLYEVGPGKPYATIQAAVDAAAASGDRDLVVVYPDTPVQWNPTGAYFENLLVYSPIKLQGVGPGGFRSDSLYIPGTVIDGRGVAGDTNYAEEWLFKVETINWSGVQAIYEGAVMYVLAEDGEFKSNFNASIDGFTITGGDQQGFANQLTPVDPTIKDVAAVQGGGIFANGFARYLQITNNVMVSNGGAYAGAIRLGTPHLTGALSDSQNDFVKVLHNRILANGGTNLAGAIGIFSGSEGYEVAFNDVCGNYSSEYGGGISHYGLSPNGSIHDNRVYFNQSYDEGGGIMIAGELQPDPSMLTPGAGPVDVFNNLIQSNLGNDDGGGLRFLMAGMFPFNVYNNIIVNNISTHEGAGISINDAPDVRVFNNTIMKNITTASAMTSNGQPAPAGLSTSMNSALLQATLPVGSPVFSNPVLFNNIFWDNRAGTFTGSSIAGIGLAGDPNPIFNWDVGIQNTTLGLLEPTFSLLQTGFGTTMDVSNIFGLDPIVVEVYDTSVMVAPWRGNPRFVDVLMVTTLATPNLLGNYHLLGASPAIDTGTGIGAPGFDFDGNIRPQGPAVDMGADEVLP